jgi:hypothetical protein
MSLKKQGVKMWAFMAAYRDKCGAVVDMVMNFGVPQKSEFFFLTA